MIYGFVVKSLISDQDRSAFVVNDLLTSASEWSLWDAKTVIAAFALLVGWQQAVSWPRMLKLLETKLTYTERQLRELYGPLYGSLQRSGALYFASLRLLGVDQQLLSLFGFDRTRNLQLSRRIATLDAFGSLAAHQIYLGEEAASARLRLATVVPELLAANKRIATLIETHQDLISPNRRDRPPSMSRLLRHEAEFNFVATLTAKRASALLTTSNGAPESSDVRNLGAGNTAWPNNLFEHVSLKHELLLALQAKYRAHLEFRRLASVRDSATRAIRSIFWTNRQLPVLLVILLITGVLAWDVEANSATFSHSLFGGWERTGLAILIGLLAYLSGVMWLRNRFRALALQMHPVPGAAIEFLIRGLWQGATGARGEILYEAFADLRRRADSLDAHIVFLAQQLGTRNVDIKGYAVDAHSAAAKVERAFRDVVQSTAGKGSQDPSNWVPWWARLSEVTDLVSSLVHQSKAIANIDAVRDHSDVNCRLLRIETERVGHELEALNEWLRAIIDTGMGVQANGKTAPDVEKVVSVFESFLADGSHRTYIREALTKERLKHIDDCTPAVRRMRRMLWGIPWSLAFWEIYLLLRSQAFFVRRSHLFRRFLSHWLFSVVARCTWRALCTVGKHEHGTTLLLSMLRHGGASEVLNYRLIKEHAQYALNALHYSIERSEPLATPISLAASDLRDLTSYRDLIALEASKI